MIKLPAQTHPHKQTAQDAYGTLPHCGVNTVVSSGFRIINIVDFTHLFLLFEVFNAQHINILHNS